jgi:hypothetical protein
MRDGFDVNTSTHFRNLYGKAAKDPAFRRVLDTLGTGFKGADPPQLTENGGCLFKLVPAGHIPSGEVPTLDEIAQGDYQPEKFETHDGDARIMCIPCMLYAKDRRNWGTMELPDTRKPLNSVFTGLYKYASQSNLSNFKVGHLCAKEHLNCVVEYLDTTNADNAVYAALCAEVEALQRLRALVEGAVAENAEACAGASVPRGPEGTGGGAAGPPGRNQIYTVNAGKAGETEADSAHLVNITEDTGAMLNTQVPC